MIWVALAGVATLVGAWYRPVSVDEAWSLVVARRMNRGDRLYRDVFYGAAPLAIWFQSLAFRALRPQAVVVRTLTVGYVIAEIWAATVLVGGSLAAASFVAGATVAFGGLHLAVHNHYGHLTAATTLWAAVAVVEGRPLLAGLVLGLGILGRYPVGVLAATSLGAVVWVGDGWSHALQLLAASAIPAAVAVAVRPSSVRWFFRRAVANKGEYLATGGVDPWSWIATRRWRRWDLAVVQAAMVVAMVLVVITPMVAVWALASGVQNASIAVVLAGVGASVVFPRFDGAHAVAAAPLAIPALGVALSGALGWWIGAAAWTAAAAGLWARRSLTRRARIRRDVPSLKHLPVAPLHGGVWPDETEDLPAEVFLLRMDAATIYACGGVINPTPFDYPAASTFGRRGQRSVLDQFAAGMAVCEGWHDRSSPLTPWEVLDGLPDSGGRRARLGRLLQADAGTAMG